MHCRRRVVHVPITSLHWDLVIWPSDLFLQHPSNLMLLTKPRIRLGVKALIFSDCRRCWNLCLPNASHTHVHMHIWNTRTCTYARLSQHVSSPNFFACVCFPPDYYEATFFASQFWSFFLSCHFEMPKKVSGLIKSMFAFCFGSLSAILFSLVFVWSGTHSRGTYPVFFCDQNVHSKLAITYVCKCLRPSGP